MTQQGLALIKITKECRVARVAHSLWKKQQHARRNNKTYCEIDASGSRKLLKFNQNWFAIIDYWCTRAVLIKSHDRVSSIYATGACVCVCVCEREKEGERKRERAGGVSEFFNRLEDCRVPSSFREHLPLSLGWFCLCEKLWFSWKKNQ